MTPRITRALIALLAAALLIRLAWGLTQGPELDARLGDQFEYISLARNLLAGHGLQFVDERFSDEVYAFRAPGYPLFLAAAGGSVRAARVGQALLDTSTVLAAFILARRWLSPVTSLVAALIVAFNPFLVYFSALILSETLFTALLMWGMVLLAWKRNFVWGGLLLAASVLVRPSAIALPVVLGIAGVFVMHHADEVPPRWRWLRLPVGTTMILLTALALLPWAVRNRIILGEWVILTTNGGITRYDGFHPGATGASDQSFVAAPDLKYIQRLEDAPTASPPRKPEVLRDREFHALASQWIRTTWREDPRRLARLSAIKLARTWSPIPLSAEFGSRRSYRLIAMAYSIPTAILCVVGIVWGAGLPRKAKFFLLVAALYFTVIHALSVGSLRYRVPVEPALAVIAACGLQTLVQALRRPTWRRLGSSGESTPGAPVDDRHT